MNALSALALMGVSLMPVLPAPGPQVSTTSQAFADRVARLEARIAEDASRKLFAPGQQPLLRVQLEATRRAYAACDPAAPGMLDVIDRQLADVDRHLSRAEDGRALTVHVGDSVTVALYDEYFWNIENSDPAVLTPKIGVMWMRGVQGGFTAKQAGTAVLRLTPRAPVPSSVKSPIVFTVVVLPR